MSEFGPFESQSRFFEMKERGGAGGWARGTGPGPA